MALRPRVQLSIMNFAHNRLSQMMPTLTFPDADMFVRGYNDHNDSRQRPNLRSPRLSLLDEAGEAHFRAAFGIDAGRVRALWS